ncbi:hypothetical protein [Streptomyces sp. NPDC050560]|uniref:hypothetical protein n=1 Tax=Streptomyces sp. NPDC050560 TaxID=3365630 RepID=UPI0037957C0D
MTQEPAALVLVAEAAKKSGLVWARGGEGRERPLWHVWHDEAVCVIGDGPGEQPLTGLHAGAPAEVVIRSKDKGGRIVAFTAAVTELVPGTEAWDAAADELRRTRLNTPDADGVVARWGRECRLLRLAPGQVHGEAPTGSLAAPPPHSPAVTRGAPTGLFGRRRRRR